MMNVSYDTSGVCARRITFDIDDGALHNVKFHGGCPGNTVAVAKLLEGMEADKAADILRGNQCGARGTSCADQLAKAIDGAIAGAGSSFTL